MSQRSGYEGNRGRMENEMLGFDVEGHVTYALRNAEVKRWPFPHFFAQDVFPWDAYRMLQGRIVCQEGYEGSQGRLYGRKFADPGDIPDLAFMKTPEFLRNVASIFLPEMHAHFAKRPMEFFTDLRLVRDGEGYQIGPHTDAPWKLVSLLFYFPLTGDFEGHGTSIYVPRDPAFRCPGGPHHKFDDFKRIHTAPFVPNTCFGFWKTDNSFHGVEPIREEMRRDVLLYNIYDKAIYLEYNQSVGE